MSERVLDIGIGSGGSYIKKTSGDVRRFGLDVELPPLFGLVNLYPSVLPVAGSAEHLPFAENSFRKIEIILPNGELALPGLEIEHPRIDPKVSEELKTRHPYGWYPELSRVLAPQGELLLIGDVLYFPSIQKTSAGFFNIASTRPVDLDEFKQLNTRSVRNLLEKYVYDYSFTPEQRREFKDGLIEIKMVNKKIG